MHIAITGNIGAGKTSLTRLLADHYGWDTFFEPVESNPYLKDFYADMVRWSFHVQVFFLGSRFRQMLQINDHPGNLFQDRTIYEDAYIFADNLYESGYLSPREYGTYRQLFETMIEQIRPPDLVLYLHADVDRLMRQIASRGRDYEAGLSVAYLENLNRRYENWIGGYAYGRVLRLDANRLDFVHNSADLQTIIRQVDREIARQSG